LNVLNNKSFDLKQASPKMFDSSKYFFNLNHLKDLFTYRALIRVYEVTMELEGKMKKGLKFDDAWNSCAVNLLKASRAHSFLLIMDKFSLFVESVGNQAIKKVLTNLCALYGVTHILDDDWNGVLPLEQFKLIKEAADELLDLIRPESIALVDALDIPDNVLNSSIGSSDGNAYESLVVAASKSVLNKVEPFEGWDEALKPHLDLEFLKQGNQALLSKAKL